LNNNKNNNKNNKAITIRRRSKKINILIPNHQKKSKNMISQQTWGVDIIKESVKSNARYAKSFSLVASAMMR